MVRALVTRLGLRAWLLVAMAVLTASALAFLYVAVERLYYVALLEGFTATREAALAQQDEAVFRAGDAPLADPDDDLLLIDLGAARFLSLRRSASSVGVPQGFLEQCVGGHGVLSHFFTTAGREVLLTCRPLAPRRVLVGVGSTSSLDRRLRAFRSLALLVGAVAFAFALLLADAWLKALIVRPVQRLVRDAARHVDVPDDAWRDLPRPLLADLKRLSALLQALAADRSLEAERAGRQLEQLRRINRELEMTQGHLVQSGKLATIGEMSAGIAHEIGNPLGVIQGYLSVLSGGELSAEERAEILRILDDSIARIKRIVKDLLNFSRPSVDEDTSCEVGETVRELWRFLESQKKFKNIELKLLLDHEPLRAAIPGSRLHQILMNLLLNASDAMDGRGQVEIRAGERDGKVRIRVKDYGPGIPLDELTNVFRPFYSTKGDRGTGLGLTISNFLAEEHGGGIEVESVPGKGATFVLTFPEATPTRHDTPAPTGDPA